jgi:hypothetical protein
MIRPMTSNVSALSGIVANGHQAIHYVSSAPSKIPYGGFSPVRLQAGCQRRPSSPHGDFDVSTVAFSSVRVLFRSRTCVRRHSRLLTPHTCPVALGSASGCIVRRPHCLLWPHPSLCPPPLVSLDYASGSEDEHKFPNLLCQGLIPCRRPYSGGSRAPTMSLSAGLGLHPFCTGSATTSIHTPDYVWPHLRSCSVDLMLRPGILLAPLWTGRLRPSFHTVDRSSARRLSLHELSSHS